MRTNITTLKEFLIEPEEKRFCKQCKNQFTPTWQIEHKEQKQGKKIKLFCSRKCSIKFFHQSKKGKISSKASAKQYREKKIAKGLNDTIIWLNKKDKSHIIELKKKWHCLNQSQVISKLIQLEKNRK